MMKWHPCDCPLKQRDRLQRSWWMRVFFRHRRLYQCPVCRQRLFLSILP